VPLSNRTPQLHKFLHHGRASIPPRGGLQARALHRGVGRVAGSGGAAGSTAPTKHAGVPRVPRDGAGGGGQLAGVGGAASRPARPRPARPCRPARDARPRSRHQRAALGDGAGRVGTQRRPRGGGVRAKRRALVPRLCVAGRRTTRRGLHPPRRSARLSAPLCADLRPPSTLCPHYAPCPPCPPCPPSTPPSAAGQGAAAHRARPDAAAARRRARRGAARAAPPRTALAGRAAVRPGEPQP
jgi:hypothetical protein